MIHKEYRYTVEVEFENNGEVISLYDHNIKYLEISCNYESYNNPIIFLYLKLDRKLKNAIINNSKYENKNYINLSILRYPYDSKQKENNNVNILKETIIHKRFQYVLDSRETVFNEKETKSDSQDYQKLDSLMIGLYDQKILDLFKMNTNTVVRNSNLSSLIFHLLSGFKNLLIEPIKEYHIDQLIIPPRDSLKNILKFISLYYNIYDTSYILFADIDKTYFISKNGKNIKAKGDKYHKINIEMNNADEGAFVLTNGAYYDDDTKVINIVCANKRDIEISDTKFNGLVGTYIITDPNGNRKEIKISEDKNVNVINIPTNNIDIANIIKNEISLNFKKVSLSKCGLDTTIYTPNKEYYIINNDTNETLKCILVEKNDKYIYEEKDFILNTKLVFKVIK